MSRREDIGQRLADAVLAVDRAVQRALDHPRVAAAERWAARRLPLGGWVPGRTNLLLLALQVLLTVQAASRGVDYLLRENSPAGGRVPAVLSVVEASAPLPVWGAGFLGFAGLVFVGLAGGWVWWVVSGHAMLFALYVGFAVGTIMAAPAVDLLISTLGGGVLVAAIGVALIRWTRWDQLRFALSMVGIGVGGWTCAIGLGFDFRTATGLAVAGCAHACIAIGVVWVRFQQPGRPV